MLMQQKSSHQSQQYISQRSCRQHVSEIGPGKRRHVSSEEREQQKNSDGNPRISKSEDNALQMMNRYAAHLLHPMGQHGIASRRKDRDSGQHKILAKVHWDSR